MKKHQLAMAVFATLAVGLAPTLMAPSPAQAVGTTYYVSWSTGDDTNTGQCSTQAGSCGPWKSLTALNAMTFNPGDTILLKRGDTWTGQTLVFTESGTDTLPITLSAYGSGARPAIRPQIVDAIGILLDGVGNFAVRSIAISDAYEGVRLQYNNVSGKRNVALDDLTIFDLVPTYNSQPNLYNHTSSGISVKTYQTASDGFYSNKQSPANRLTALSNLSVTNSTFTNVGAATWFGGLVTNPGNGFQDTDHHQWIRDVTMSNLNVDQGAFWGYDVHFVLGGSFTDLVATRVGAGYNIYGAAGIAVSYSNNIEFKRITIRDTSRHPSVYYDGVGFDFEGVGRNISLVDSVIDLSDGAGIFFFNNNNSVMSDISMTNVTVARYGRNPGSPGDGEALRITQTGGWGYFSDIRLLNSYGKPDSTGPISNYRPIGITTTVVPTTYVAPLPAAHAGAVGTSTFSMGTPVSPRNDVSHEVGVKFTTSAQGLDLTALGRYWNASNARSHTLVVYRDSDKAVVAACKVSPTDSTLANGAKYCDLPLAVSLAPSTSYWLLSTEYAGGDTWADSGTSLTSTLVTVLGAGSRNESASFGLWASGAHSYGPVDMLGAVPGSNVARLSFEEAGGAIAVDKSPRNIDATVSGTSSRVLAGLSGSSLGLDGSTVSASVPDSADLEGMGTLTISAWAKADALPASGKASVLVGKDGSASGDYSYRLLVTPSGAVQFVVRTVNNAWYSSGTVVESAAGVVSASGPWVHATGTYDGSRVRLYVNGALVALGSVAISGTIGTSTVPLRVGASSGGSNITPWNGSIDEVWVLRSALNDAEVQSLFSSSNH